MPQDGNRRHYRPLPHQPSQRRCASGDFTFEEQELFRLAVGHQQVLRASGRILIRRHIYMIRSRIPLELSSHERA